MFCSYVSLSPLLLSDLDDVGILLSRSRKHGLIQSRSFRLSQCQDLFGKAMSTWIAADRSAVMKLYEQLPLQRMLSSTDPVAEGCLDSAFLPSVTP